MKQSFAFWHTFCTGGWSGDSEHEADISNLTHTHTHLGCTSKRFPSRTSPPVTIIIIIIIIIIINNNNNNNNNNINIINQHNTFFAWILGYQWMILPNFSNLSHVDPRFHLPFTRTNLHVSRLQALLEAGVDLDAPNLFGQTPLFVASWQLGSGKNRYRKLGSRWFVSFL